MSHQNDIAIKVENVSKQFLLPHQRASSIKTSFLNPFTRIENEKQMALDGVSFEVKKGEFFGIVGRNGSGKSTLLKCMAGVYTPDKGHIKVNGSLVPFIELGVGFNPELSGRDNVYLNGALLGFSRTEIDAMYEEIVDFAELEKFMDQKLKNYSSGMQVRLAFSIAIKAQADILLLDEVLAVGDENFRRKCLEYFENIKLAGKTVVFVTHDMNSVRQFCNRAVLINSGEIIDIGRPDSIVEQYSKLNLESSGKSLEKANKKHKQATDKFGNGKADIVDVWTSDRQGKAKNTFSPNEIIVANVRIKASQTLKGSVFGMTFSAQNGIDIFATNTQVQKIEIPKLEKNKNAIVSVEVKNIFSDGFYTISTAITDNVRKEIYSRVVNMHKFEVGGWELKTGFVKPDNNITIKIE